jgi:hypothetical protein
MVTVARMAGKAGLHGEGSSRGRRGCSAEEDLGSTIKLALL